MTLSNLRTANSRVEKAAERQGSVTGLQHADNTCELKARSLTENGGCGEREEFQHRLLLLGGDAVDPQPSQERQLCRYHPSLRPFFTAHTLHAVLWLTAHAPRTFDSSAKFPRKCVNTHVAGSSKQMRLGENEAKRRRRPIFHALHVLQTDELACRRPRCR